MGLTVALQDIFVAGRCKRGQCLRVAEPAFYGAPLLNPCLSSLKVAYSSSPFVPPSSLLLHPHYQVLETQKRQNGTSSQASCDKHSECEILIRPHPICFCSPQDIMTESRDPGPGIGVRIQEIPERPVLNSHRQNVQTYVSKQTRRATLHHN